MGRVDRRWRRRLAAARPDGKTRRERIHRGTGGVRRAEILRLRSWYGFRRPGPLDARRARSRDVLLRWAPDLLARRRAREPLPAARPRRPLLPASCAVRPRHISGILRPPQLLPGCRSDNQEVSLSTAARVPHMASLMKTLRICVVLASLIPAQAFAQESQPSSSLWIVAGAASGTLRGHCQECGAEFPFRHGGVLVGNVGYRVTPRLDVGA